MRNKTPLMLIEQVIMILVLAVVSVFCVMAFARAGEMAKKQGKTDNAYICAQSAAELLKHFRGNHFKAANELDVILLGNFLVVNYDENWQVCDQNGEYILYATPISVNSQNLCKDKITVAERNGEVLAELEVSYQRRAPNE